MNIVLRWGEDRFLRREAWIKCKGYEDERQLCVLLRECICAKAFCVCAGGYYACTDQDAKLPSKCCERESRGFREFVESEAASLRDCAENLDAAMVRKRVDRCESGIRFGIGMCFGKEFGKRKLKP